MTDIEIISNLINDNVNLLNNFGHISEHHTKSTIISIVQYHNYLADNYLRLETEQYREWILIGYYNDETNTKGMLFRIYLFYLIHKYDYYFKVTKLTSEIKRFLLDAIKNSKVKLIKREGVQLENQDGLWCRDIVRLLDMYDVIYDDDIIIKMPNMFTPDKRSKMDRLFIDDKHELLNIPNITYFMQATTFDEVINKMSDAEDKCNDSYGLFRFSVVGSRPDRGHCNLFLYDYKINKWYRIEPAGTIMYGHSDDEINTYQYSEIDNKIRQLKSNYLSQNDYHYLPSMHYINPGPYCVYYSVMIVEEYVKCGNMIDAIEKVSSLDYINNKLKDYDEKLACVKLTNYINDKKMEYNNILNIV